MQRLAATVTAGGTTYPVGTPKRDVPAELGVHANESAWVDDDQAEPAAVTPPAGPGAYDPGEHKVEDVTAYVADHPDEVVAVLDAERAGKARSTLIAELEKLAGGGQA